MHSNEYINHENTFNAPMINFVKITVYTRRVEPCNSSNEIVCIGHVSFSEGYSCLQVGE